MDPNFCTCHKERKGYEGEKDWQRKGHKTSQDSAQQKHSDETGKPYREKGTENAPAIPAQANGEMT